MMIRQLASLFRYNAWAWNRVLPSLARLDETAYRQVRPFFWRSLQELLVHCLAAELIWYERLHGHSPSALLDPAEAPTVAAVEARWAPLPAAWQEFIAGQDEGDLQRPLAYRNTRGEPFVLPVVDILHHVVNHATEHRSQLTPVLFQLGVPTPPLDYLRYCLETGATGQAGPLS